MNKEQGMMKAKNIEQGIRNVECRITNIE